MGWCHLWEILDPLLASILKLFPIYASLIIGLPEFSDHLRKTPLNAVRLVLKSRVFN